MKFDNISEFQNVISDSPSQPQRHYDALRTKIDMWLTPNEIFGASLINNLSNKVFANNDDELQKLCKTTMDTLNKFAPIKKKYAGGNQMA